MIYKFQITKSFKKDYKRLNAEEKKLADDIIKKLLSDIPLPINNHDHNLTGNYSGFRECHVKPDLLLVYKKQLKP